MQGVLLASRSEWVPRQLWRRAPRRRIMGFVRNALGLEPPSPESEPTAANRFFPWDQSPYPQIRERASRIMQHGRCRVTGKNIAYVCPLSGIPTHHSREAWEMDRRYHQERVYEKLRKVNVYEHDLRSGRAFPEFEFPEEQGRERTVNMANWDLFFYTRGFYSMDTEFQLAAVTKMLSYPLTIAAMLSQFSPYFLNPKGPITLEGLKSLAALRYTLYPGGSSSNSALVRRGDTSFAESLAQSTTAVSLKNRPVRLFILGARAEAQLPGYIWKQLQYLFPATHFEIYFVGPECYFDRARGTYVRRHDGKPFVCEVDPTLKLFYYTDYFDVFHRMQEFYPYDPFFDCFFTFHPGYASMALGQNTWLDNGTVQALLDTKCAVFTTGYSKEDIRQDMRLLTKQFGSQMDLLMDPVENLYKSTKWELNDLDPQEVYQFNMYIAGYRGKRYHTTRGSQRELGAPWRL